MGILIDGYNLLHASGIMGRGVGPGGLQRSRRALLNFLASTLQPEEARRTVVVFDAHDAPAGLPRSMTHDGLTIRFAVGYETADALIEELILADSAPRRLTVVSADHEIRRAARRRRARSVASDCWFAELLERRRERPPGARPLPAKPGAPLSVEEVEYWVRRFSDDLPEDAETHGTPDSHHQPPQDDAIYNPFPPGYAEDVEEDESPDKS